MGFELLMRLVRASGLAALVATHNHELASRMDRRITLEAGEVVEDEIDLVGVDESLPAGVAGNATPGVEGTEESTAGQVGGGVGFEATGGGVAGGAAFAIGEIVVVVVNSSTDRSRASRRSSTWRPTCT